MGENKIIKKLTYIMSPHKIADNLLCDLDIARKSIVNRIVSIDYFALVFGRVLRWFTIFWWRAVA